MSVSTEEIKILSATVTEGCAVFGIGPGGGSCGHLPRIPPVLPNAVWAQVEDASWAHIVVNQPTLTALGFLDKRQMSVSRGSHGFDQPIRPRWRSHERSLGVIVKDCIKIVET